MLRTRNASGKGTWSRATMSVRRHDHAQHHAPLDRAGRCWSIKTSPRAWRRSRPVGLTPRGTDQRNTPYASEVAVMPFVEAAARQPRDRHASLERWSSSSIQNTENADQGSRINLAADINVLAPTKTTLKLPCSPATFS
jgi:hypothetical protein